MALDRVSGPLASAINLHQSGHLDKAIKGYLEILEQDPAQADANHLVGVALLSRGVGDDRVQMFSYLSKAVELRPEVAEFHNDLGNAYWVKRRFEQAESAFNQCVMLKPRFVRGYFNLGNARLMQRKFVAAADAYRQCIAQDSNWAQAHYNLGNCLQQLGELDAAMAAYNQAISLKENYHDAYLARSTVLLKQGDYFQGWRDYEHRLSSEEYIILSKSGKSWWRGQAFPGQTLLVYAEQGIGDAIQFVRYLPLIRRLGGSVVLVADSSLIELFQRSFKGAEVIDKTCLKDREKRPEFDLQVALMSLPKLFGTSVDTIPDQIPYLVHNGTATHRWRQKMQPGKFSIGIVWAGNPAQKDDVSRSCTLSELLPLVSLPGVEAYSLQFGAPAGEIGAAANEGAVKDMTRYLGDFADTADFIAALDLVITVDTAAAHLAGALGCPVWVILWQSHCWRYLQKRRDSPWYPGMRLFRQINADDWTPVIDEMFGELRKELQSR